MKRTVKIAKSAKSSPTAPTTPGALGTHGATRRDGLPTLSRVPKELGREDRHCERCGAETEHIVYRVPKRVLVVYVKNHENNVQATCRECARSTVLTGEERERRLADA